MEEAKNWWRCSECGYTLQSSAPPETCPSCHKKCIFIDATCYIPDCGGPDNTDPRIGQEQ